MIVFFRMRKWKRVLIFCLALIYCNRELKAGSADSLMLATIQKAGEALHRRGELDSAITVFQKGLNLSGDTVNERFKCVFLIKLGYMNREKGIYNVSSQFLYEALKIADKKGFERLKADCYNGIAILASIQKEAGKAMEYYKLSLAINQKMKNTSGQASAYNNMGVLYMDYGRNAAALRYFLKALTINTKTNDEYNVAINNENIGLAYSGMGNNTLALIYYGRALRTWYKFSDNLSVAINLGYMGNAFIRQKKEGIAIDTLRKAYDYAVRANSQNSRKDIAVYLAEAYELKGDYKNALHFTKLIRVLNDSILNDEKIKEITKIQMNYGFSKLKAQDSLRYQMDMKLREGQLKTEKNYKYIVSAVLLLILILLVFVYKNYNQKLKANIIITQQKNLVEQKQSEILDSITYANRIQEAILSNREIIDREFPDNFILFRPKDIVSGDFYWSTEQSDKFYLAVCDSTGHGVPGAFMSLLNMSFLSEAINEKNYDEPDKVFNHVRRRLETTIGKNGSQDGMDGILLCFDRSSKQITYAAANNAPVLVSGGKLVEQPKDKIPVGRMEKNERFHLYTLHWQPGDMLYLYTDGYADQFGGLSEQERLKGGKKFKYKRLNQLLLEISSKPLYSQKRIIEQHLEDWSGSLEQVDDICVIGIALT